MIAIVVIAAIGISELGKAGKSVNKSEKSTNEILVQEYREELENRLCNIIKSINGAGNTKVMITMDCGIETIYAVQEERKGESNLDNSTVGGIIEENYSEKNEYIIIESDSTGEGGLIVKLIQPKVRGVVIVCEGGESSYVKEQIMDAAKAVLDINAAKISVSKMSNK